jgi:hypothetical protein
VPAEFYLRRNLLEQSPPSLTGNKTDFREYFMGESASFILPFSLSVYNNVDGRKSFYSLAIGSVRICIIDGGNLLFYFTKPYYCR